MDGRAAVAGEFIFPVGALGPNFDFPLCPKPRVLKKFSTRILARFATSTGKSFPRISSSEEKSGKEQGMRC
jgi:hypothetical protein